MQQQLNGDTGPETDLQDLVVRSNVEQLDDLRCGISVHARHDDPTQPSQDALRTAEHAHQEFAHPSHTSPTKQYYTPKEEANKPSDKHVKEYGTRKECTLGFLPGRVRNALWFPNADKISFGSLQRTVMSKRCSHLNGIRAVKPSARG